MNIREAMRHLEYLGMEPVCAKRRPRVGFDRVQVAAICVTILVFVLVGATYFMTCSGAGTSDVSISQTQGVRLEDTADWSSPVTPYPSYVPAQFRDRALTHLDREWLKFGILSVQVAHAVMAGLSAK